MIEQARAQARIPSPGQDRDHSLKHRSRRVRIEEEIAKLRRIEADHESPEGLVPPALTSGKRGEAPSREIVSRQRPIELRSRFNARLQGDRDAGGEDGVEKRSGIPCQNPAIAG